MTRPRSYKKNFMLSSAKHEILNAYKYKKKNEEIQLFSGSDKPRTVFFPLINMERHSCLIRLLGMMFFQVRLYATELPLYLVRFTSVIIVSYIFTRS